jgi:hypothetical protein
MTDEERKALVERLRDMGEHPCRVDLPMGADLREAADQIEADGQRIAELEAKVNTLWLFGRQLRDFAMQHYRDWDGEPEDVVELRTAIAAWDSALDVATILKGQGDD